MKRIIFTLIFIFVVILAFSFDILQWNRIESDLRWGSYSLEDIILRIIKKIDKDNKDMEDNIWYLENDIDDLEDEVDNLEDKIDDLRDKIEYLGWRITDLED